MSTLAPRVCSLLLLSVVALVAMREAGARPLATAQAAATYVVLEDDFNDGVLNADLWAVVTTIPQGSAMIIERNGRLEIWNRAHLNTVQAFDPAELGGLRITGEWTVAGAGDDFIEILTRSDGVPRPPFGATSNGIEFLVHGSGVFGTPNMMTILGVGGAAGTITNLASEGSLIIDPGITYLFEVMDDGVNLEFTLKKKSNHAQKRTITAKSEYRSSKNLITFHNRERCCWGSHIAHLDNVAVARMVTPVAVDIKPGNEENNVHLRSGERVPVAILTTDKFDATSVDPLSVRFGPKDGVEVHNRGHIEDADGDGRPDMVLHFGVLESGLECGMENVALKGMTKNGTPIGGSDAIRLLGCGETASTGGRSGR